MHCKNLARACLLAAWVWPGLASALVVDIQGVYLYPTMAGASCVDIAGVYPGLRIEPDRPGQIPRICHNAGRINSVGIANATLIATAPSRHKPVTIRFEHEFPQGVNGKVVARAKLQGFFATESGVGVPTGDSLNLKAFFVQGRHQDPLAEPFAFTVGEALESALFEYSTKKTYVTAGPRSLKGVMHIAFDKPGHKLTFPEKCLISLDGGARFEDKLETLGGEEEALVPLGEGVTPPPPAGETPPPSAAPPQAEAEKPSKAPPLPELPPLAPLPH